MTRWLFPVLAAVAGLASGAAATAWFGGGAMPGERAAIERIVRSYLLDHPEIIPEAMDRLQQREAGAGVAAHRAALTQPFGNAWSGNPRGDVTVVEFYDYQCGYCRASLPAIRQLVAADPNVRIVYRELPILSDESRTAARASLVAAAQGRFAAFHEALWAAGRVTDASVAAAAKRAGLAPPSPATSARVEAEIAANLRLAATLGVNGTPSWVVGDRVVAGAQTLASLRQAVAAARDAR